MTIGAGRMGIDRAGATGTGGTGGTAVSVTFQVSASTFFGQDVYLVGDRPELGAWNTASALAMTPGGCVGSTCTWKTTVSLPPSVAAQFKFIKKPGDSGTSLTWEGGSNRAYTAPASGSATTTAATGSNTDPGRGLDGSVSFRSVNETNGICIRLGRLSGPAAQTVS